MRALIRSAEPRIEARVEAVMARSYVRAAISRVAAAAAAEATREVEIRHRGALNGFSPILAARLGASALALVPSRLLLKQKARGRGIRREAGRAGKCGPKRRKVQTLVAINGD